MAGVRPTSGGAVGAGAGVRADGAHERELLAQIVQYLRDNRHEVLPDEIRDNLHINLRSMPSLVASIKVNPKIKIVNKRAMLYRPTIETVTDEATLFDHIQGHRWGTLVVDLMDAYPGVLSDLHALTEKRLVVRLTDVEQKKDVVFPRDQRYDHLEADQDMKDLWNSVEVPLNPADLDAKLKEMGESAVDPQSAVRPNKRKLAGRAQSGRARKRMHISNTHLIGQYDFLPKAGAAAAAASSLSSAQQQQQQQQQ